VALVRTHVSEESNAYIIAVETISELGITFTVTADSFNTNGGDTFSEMSVVSRTTRRHVPENSILHSHRREKFKSYKVLFCL
jgi:hypothetical protein